VAVAVCLDSSWHCREIAARWIGCRFKTMLVARIACVSHNAFVALRHRDFTLLIVASGLLLTIAVLAQEVALGYALYQRTHDPLTLGLIGLAEAVPYIVVALFGGAIADRKPRKRIMLIAISVMLLAAIVLEVLMRHAERLSDLALLTSVYSAIAVIGFARGFYGPAASALRATLVPPEIYANASAWAAAFWQIGAVLGPLVAGFLYMPIGLSGTLTVVVALIAVVFLMLSFIRAPASPVVERHEPMLIAIREGFRFVFQSRALLYSISLDLVAVLFGGVVAILPAFAEDVLHVGPEWLGWLRAAPSIGAVLTLLLLARFSPVGPHLWRNMLLAVTGFGAAMLVFAISENLWLSLLMLFLTGAFDSVSVVIRQYLLNSVPPDHLRGRVLAVNGIFVTCSNEIGAFESGVAARVFGLRNSVLAGASVTIGVVVWLSIAARDLLRDRHIGQQAPAPQALK
jgi:MFS family permease